MIWLIKKIFTLGVLAALVFIALQFQVGGRPLKNYVVDFYNSSFLQEALRQAKETAQNYINKKTPSAGENSKDDSTSNQPMDDVDDKDRQELEKVLKQNKPTAPVSHKKH